MVTRRDFLRAALAAGASASAAWAQSALTPATSPRPLPRPRGVRVAAIPTGRELIEAAGLGGRVSYVVADAASGEVLEAVDPLLPMPPASTAKAITTAYALDRLGADHRFRTRLVADGPISGGRLDGNLWLVGGGDPVLDTDALAAMVGDLLADAGITEVTGRLMLDHGALPYIREIDPGQPPEAGYNPAMSGLNLNFNRVHFQWLREDGGYSVSMDARSGSLRPMVRLAAMQVVDRRYPVYTFAEEGGVERWTVAREALGEGGGRWLPVRRPHLYAADVFLTLAADAGLALAAPGRGGAGGAPAAVPADGALLVDRESPPLSEILRGMMRWSTNLTAEVAGLTATRAQGGSPEGLVASARQMDNWARNALGPQQPRFVDHSGLGDASRIHAADMTRAMVNAGPSGALRALMRDVPLRTEAGEIIEGHPVAVSAKTGTLNFVSALAGYARHRRTDRDLAFAIFCADLPRRAALTAEQRVRPPGARSYNGRAKRLQQALIERWGQVYGEVSN